MKDDPKLRQNWLFAKAIDPIGSAPKKVSVREGGFPLGFILDKLDIHLYDKGVEIATDLSENRAPLTREEAHEYLVIKHTSAHKKEGSMPARVVLPTVPEGWEARPKGESFDKTYYVKVDEAGLPVESFEDEACETKVTDSYYEGVLKGQVFLPAIKNGKAVASVVPVKPAELVR